MEIIGECRNDFPMLTGRRGWLGEDSHTVAEDKNHNDDLVEPCLEDIHRHILDGSAVLSRLFDRCRVSSLD